MDGQALDVVCQAVIRSVSSASTMRACSVRRRSWRQTAVRHFVGQRVLKGVGVLREEVGRVEELGGLEVPEAVVHGRLGQFGDSLQQRQGHLRANDRRRLQQALRRRVAGDRYALPALPAPWLASGWVGRACAR